MNLDEIKAIAHAELTKELADITYTNDDAQNLIFAHIRLSEDDEEYLLKCNSTECLRFAVMAFDNGQYKEISADFDFFMWPSLIPTNVQAIIDSFTDTESYKECERVKNELKAAGYGCDYGLSGELYGLVKL